MTHMFVYRTTVKGMNVRCITTDDRLPSTGGEKVMKLIIIHIIAFYFILRINPLNGIRYENKLQYSVEQNVLYNLYFTYLHFFFLF